MSVIQVENLRVTFQGRDVLKDLSISVQGGTVCALLGPNGAGKTTLIRSLVNIYTPRSGQSSIFGVPSGKLGEKEFRRIGYISENQEIPDWMSVGNFLQYCASFYPSWDNEWCKRKLESFELPYDRPLSQLSRGMRTKAILISSLAYHPELLILDEPFMGLDPIVRDEFIDMVLELAIENKATTFISSHDLSEVERIADSIAFLIDGKISAHLPLDEILRKFRFVTLDLKEQTFESLGSIAKGCLSPKQEGALCRFVHSDFDGTLVEQLAEIAPKVVVSEIKEMTLKEIYRALIGREVF
ncbi:MAG: ABC transporter ATP-binding protein [SAR324 cluster bacterium]|uniref:ABC transporter ATP-binding protein n=1 Tax=SAR324 cluster bacterium TaxID=2024889 RepID=A0A7X9FRQ4_9DELT|nr:ABC transporter ATP-binding protein [SAR324 cluster bacterium]